MLVQCILDTANYGIDGYFVAVFFNGSL